MRSSLNSIRCGGAEQMPVRSRRSVRLGRGEEASHLTSCCGTSRANLRCFRIYVETNFCCFSFLACARVRTLKNSPVARVVSPPWHSKSFGRPWPRGNIAVCCRCSQFDLAARLLQFECVMGDRVDVHVATVLHVQSSQAVK